MERAFPGTTPGSSTVPTRHQKPQQQSHIWGPADTHTHTHPREGLPQFLTSDQFVQVQLLALLSVHMQDQEALGGKGEKAPSVPGGPTQESPGRELHSGRLTYKHGGSSSDVGPVALEVEEVDVDQTTQHFWEALHLNQEGNLRPWKPIKGSPPLLWSWATQSAGASETFSLGQWSAGGPLTRAIEPVRLRLCQMLGQHPGQHPNVDPENGRWAGNPKGHFSPVAQPQSRRTSARESSRFQPSSRGCLGCFWTF